MDAIPFGRMAKQILVYANTKPWVEFALHPRAQEED
jgi:hypothetical protein